MRKFMGVATLLAGLALLFSAGALPAYADPGNPPGANGTVKIHEFPTHKNGSEMANDPKVCQFKIHGFNFDAGQTGRWWIQEHKWGNGDASKAVLPGTYKADGNGDWTEGPYKLADGHYKLFVELTHTGGNGNTVITYKHKVFKVECEVAAGTTGGTTPGGTTTTGGTSTTTTGGTTTGGTTTGGTTTTGGNNGNGTGNATGGGNNGNGTGNGTAGGNNGNGTTGGGNATGGNSGSATTGGTASGTGNTAVTTPTAVRGVESAPTGQVELAQPATQPAVAGSEAAPALLALAALPATATSPDAALGLIGLAMTTIGAALLRRPRRT